MSLVIHVRRFTKHGNTRITVTTAILKSSINGQFTLTTINFVEKHLFSFSLLDLLIVKIYTKLYSPFHIFNFYGILKFLYLWIKHAFLTQLEFCNF